jgi:hypothetical protein
VEEVVISVSGKMSDGKVATDKKSIQNKRYPVQQEQLEVKQVLCKGPKSNLEIATIGAKLEDFDFEVGLNVVGFKSNRPRNCSCTGDKLNAQCKAVLSKGKRRSSYYFRN